MFKISSLTLTTALALLLIPSQIVHAVTLNGSFETGNFDNWTTTGQTSVEDSGFGVTPTDGDKQAALQTLQNSTGITAVEIETFLGLSTGTLTNQGATEGSAIKQIVIANAGDTLSFSWNFLTDQDPDPTYDDLAFFTLNNSLTENTNIPNTPSFSVLAKETEYQSFSYTISSSGIYTLGFGIVDRGDTTVNSALLVDNVQIRSSAVPEPMTMLGALTALGFGAVFRAKRDNV